MGKHGIFKKKTNTFVIYELENSGSLVTFAKSNISIGFEEKLNY